MYACYAVGVPAALAAGRVVRATRPGRLMLTALVMVEASAVISAAAGSAWELDLARIVQGLGTGLITGTAAAALTALHPAKDTGRAPAAASAATAGGIGVGAAAAGALVQWAPAPLVTPYVVLAVAAGLASAALLTVPAAAMGTTAIGPGSPITGPGSSAALRPARAVTGRRPQPQWRSPWPRDRPQRCRS